MKIALICGSPKGDNSTSYTLLNMLSHNLNDVTLTPINWNTPNENVKDYEELSTCDAIAIAFPLYVDGVPSHVLHHLTQFEKLINNQSHVNTEIKVYPIVNNGFFDDWQNQTALDIIKNWCTHCNLTYGAGLGIGGGGMIAELGNIPDEAGPKKNIGLAIKELAKLILNKETGDDRYAHPNFPKFLYKLAAQTGWRKLLKQNGLKRTDISRKLK